MKKYISILAIIVVVSVVLFSCGGDEEVAPIAKKTTKTITVKVKQDSPICQKEVIILEKGDASKALVQVTQAQNEQSYTFELEAGNWFTLSVSGCKGFAEATIYNEGIEVQRNENPQTINTQFIVK